MVARKITLTMLATFFILLMPLINAIGISPAYFEIPYKPGEETTYECAIRIGERESNTVMMYTRGDLNDSITIEEEIKELQPGLWTRFRFKIKFPNEAQAPGLHENRLGIVEKSEVERSGVSVLAGVETRLLIRVPFEGRFLELKSFEIPPGEVNKPVTFYATVISRGKEDIDSAVMHLDIVDPQGQIIAKIKSESTPIKKDEEKTLNVQWQTDVPGPYNANGFIIYDNNFLELDPKGFNIGDLLLEITNVLSPSVNKGEIAKVQFNVKSFWNVGIEDVYATLTVEDKQGNILGEEQSPAMTVGAWNELPVVIYWDSRNQETGEYKGKITLHYSGKTDEEAVTIEIKNPSILLTLKENSLLTVGISLAIFMLLVNIILLLRKKKKKQG